MEADWEVEVGGGAPVIDAVWPGLIDLRLQPERVGEIAEAAGFQPLGELLVTLNRMESGLWTSKCDLWEPEAADVGNPDPPNADGLSARIALACYVDLLPVEGNVFAKLDQAENCCREWVARLAPNLLSGCCVDLVIRQAIAGQAEGFGITAYVGASGVDRSAASKTLACGFAAFASAIPTAKQAGTPASKLQ